MKRTLLRDDNDIRTISFSYENGKLCITLSQKQKYLDLPFCEDPDRWYTNSIILNIKDTQKLRDFLIIEIGEI
jgi:hypothetical protein